MAVYDDEQALDLAYAGQPFVQIGAADDTTLDLASAGQPFTPTGASAAAPGTATSQAQSASASGSVTGAITAHRYWRVYITAVTGTPHLSVTEVAFRTAVGGASVCTGGTPIYSNQSAGFEASKAFDANNSTSWYVNQGTYPLPQWIGYDFGAGNDKGIIEFALTCWNVNEMPSNFQLQYSDDAVGWTTLYERYDETWSAANQVKAYSSSGGAFDASLKTIWRVRATAVDGGSVFGLSELAMMEVPDGASVTTGGTALASSQQEAGGPPSAAFDGIAADSALGSYWSGTSTNAWIGYQFPKAVDIQQVAITARVTYQNQSPTTFSVEYYDGVKFVPTLSVTGNSGWISGEKRKFPAPNSATSATTRQWQTSSASVSVSGGDPTATTSQGQSASASAVVSVDATVATSQAQHAVVLTPLDSTASSRQAQSASSVATVSIAATATTSQAQGASAAGSVYTPWGIVFRDYNTDFYANNDPAGTFSNTLPAQAIANGTHILLCVEFNGADVSGTTVSATDTAGNTYTATLPVKYSSGSAGMLWLYALNVTGHAANQITVTFTASTATYGRWYTTVNLQSPGTASFDVLARNATNIASTTISAGPFTTHNSGFILAAITAVNYDTESVWTGAMQFIAPRSTFFRGVGYLSTGSALASTSVGVTGSTVSTKRLLSAIALQDGAAAPVDPNGTVTTKQGQTGSAQAGTSASASAATSQGQRASGQLGAAASGQASTAQAQQSASAANAYFVATATSAQSQAGSAQAGVSADAQAGTSSAQQVAGNGIVSSDLAGQGAQTQSAAGQFGLGVDGTVQTACAQSASGSAAVAFVLDAATGQAQQASAAGGISSDAAVATAQAQATDATAGVAVDASVQSGQAQRLVAATRGESNNSVESAQRQSIAGVMQLGVVGDIASAQAQGLAALAELAADSTATMGQVQHIGDGNVAVVSVDASVTTGQERQHVEGELDAYLTRPGALSATSIRLRPALAGTVRFRATPDHTH